MATKKIKLSTIKQLIREGAATDLDKLKNKPPKKELEKIGVSYGQTGINGALFLGKNGRMYAIINRSSTIFEYI